MQLELIIAALKQRCAGTFDTRIAGAAEFKLLLEKQALPVPCAFVIPLDDNPQENIAMNGVRQQLHDSFAVIVAINNTGDERGQAAVHSVDSIRTVLWGALLNWQPTDLYDGITYQGGQLLSLDRARLWYQFEFAAPMEIGTEDGWQGDLIGLPHFDGGTVRADTVDPTDLNVVQTSAPDGRIDAGFVFPKTGNLPS